jgi:hypothetical protein
LIGGGGVAVLVACEPSCDWVSVVAAAGFCADDAGGAVGGGDGLGSADADGTAVAVISTERVKAINEADRRRLVWPLT